jgi:hypothetical protein
MGMRTTDCLAVLTTDVKTAFHLENQVVAAFLDIFVQLLHALS